MLCNLQIENIAIIEKASVDFVNGLNVLSGETGAGKSIIIDAINAVLGEKTSRELIRTGANAAFVQALFSDVSEDANAFLRTQDIPLEDDGSLLVQRKIFKDGKNACRINGIAVTVSVLKKLGILLINIHGQRDSQELLNAEIHYSFLDRFGELSEYLQEYRLAFEAWKYADSMYKKATADEENKDRMIDLLQYQIRELETADIRIGEREKLTEKKKLIRNLETLNKALQSAFSAMDTAVESAGAASYSIREASKINQSVSVLENSLQEAVSILEDCRDETRDVLSQLDSANFDAEAIEERLDLLYRFSKKYGKTEEDMLSFLAECKEQLSELENAQQSIAYWENERAQCEQKRDSAASLLSEHRHASADKLRNRIEEELHFLDMPEAVFTVQFNAVAPCEYGTEAIEFYISANPGEQVKPLVKVASGGELSRVMLAIKNALADKDSVGTLIFDEIDTGVSGRAADKISRKLSQAASNRQVLCITHLSQIAARADAHFLVEKAVINDNTYTAVNKLDYSGRIGELARMNGGVSLTKVHLDSARMLLEEAGIREE